MSELFLGKNFYFILEIIIQNYLRLLGLDT